MTQFYSPAPPDVVARRLMQEQELQQVIVNELMRRKLLEHSTTDSHKFVLDPQHNALPALRKFSAAVDVNSVFTGIIGKGVGFPVGSERVSVRTDKKGDLTLSNVKIFSVKRAQRSIKLHTNDKLRLDKLQDMLLEEQLIHSIPGVSVSCDKKTISPRKERDNLNTIMAPRRHVLKLNLGALMTSPAVELHSQTSPRGSFTERCNGDSGRFVIAFASARSKKIEHGSAILDPAASSFQNNPDFETTALDNNVTLHKHTSTLGAGSQQSIAPVAKRPFEIKRDSKFSRRSDASFPEIPRIMGSSAPSGFLSKVHSLRSLLTNPVSCHLPTTPELPTANIYAHSQSADCYPQSSRDVQDWSILIAKHESRILKPKPNA